MIRFRWWRRIHVYFGYKSFYKGYPNTTRILVRGSKEIAETILGNGYIEEWGPSEK